MNIKLPDARDLALSLERRLDVIEEDLKQVKQDMGEDYCDCSCSESDFDDLSHEIQSLRGDMADVLNRLTEIEARMDIG